MESCPHGDLPEECEDCRVEAVHLLLIFISAILLLILCSVAYAILVL